MRSGLGQAAVETAAVQTTVTAPLPKEVPYDYVSRFLLTGQRGRRVQDVINIGIDGAFVAVAIGYSFIPALADPPIPLGPVEVELASNSVTNLPQLFANNFVELLSLAIGENTADRQETVNQLERTFRAFMRCVTVRLCGIDFRYAVIDGGTGRELQNQPIHNIAGLGEAGGNRPFRLFAKPMIFAARSTIRIEVEEISEGSIYHDAELFLVLHGYKTLGATGLA
jgi:hypothetical protein